MERLSSEKSRIMVIDDSITILKIVRRALEGIYDIYTVSSGEEALPLIPEVKPDLILLDVEMPKQDGFETIKLIKQNDEIKHIPVIFLTAKNDIDFEVEAFGLGAVDYIAKPFATPLLIKRMELHLSMSEHEKMLTSYNQNLQQMVEEKTEIIKELQYAIVYTLADLVEMRDGSTGGHVLRTQHYFKVLLDYLAKHNIYQEELSGIDQRLLLEASQLHDIGKVAIPDSILLKPAKLTEEEFEIMKTHTLIGEKAIIKAMALTKDKEFLNFAAIVTISHHEKWDGSGYPKKLVGESIPLAGRLMAVVDVYDALVSERPYKKKMTHDEAKKIMVNGRGSHFDPVLIDSFLDIEDRFKEISELKEE